MTGSAWRFTKLGSRMCTRAGLAEPSATTKQPSSPRGDSIALYTSPGGTRKPSVTSLKWWISASIEVASSWRGGSATLRSVVMYGPSGRPSIACSTILSDSRISVRRTL